MTKQTLIFILLMSCCCATAAAWTWRVQTYRGRIRTIKFAYLGSPQDARHLSAQRFKEAVESKSNGALRVELYYGGQLGGDRDAIEGIKLGTIEMTVAGAGIFANFEPCMSVTALPFLFDNFAEAWAYLDSKLYARVSERLRNHGIRVLGHWENGFRCITNSVRSIHSPDDLQGLKIRTPENPMILAIMVALGANPSPLPWTEVYMALQQKAFDGQENPIPVIYVNKIYEIQQYLSITNHVYEPMPVVISEIFWAALSRIDQHVIQEALSESQHFNRHLASSQTVEMLARLKQKGMIVSRPDHKPFQQATKRVREQFVDSIGAGRIDAAYRFVEDYRRTTDESGKAGNGP